MTWHVDWQDAVVLLLAAVGIAAATLVRARTVRQRCQGCAMRDRHAPRVSTTNG